MKKNWRKNLKKQLKIQEGRGYCISLNSLRRDWKKLLKEIKEIPEQILAKADLRKKFRMEKKYKEADEIREEIQKQGYIIEDVGYDYIIYKRLISC